jgi:acetyl-CoA acetyltransferase
MADGPQRRATGKAATGAVVTTRLIHSTRRDGLKRGIVTLRIGGGQGIALDIETLLMPDDGSI